MTRPPAGPFVDACLDAGFAVAGVALADFTRHLDTFNAWLDRGLHGDMHWMLEHRQARADVEHVLPGCRSIICVADRYAQRPAPAPGHGHVADYASGRDYHRVMRKRLHALCDMWREDFADAEFRACVDTAPVLEREAAAAAGLGAIGKNTMLIEPGVGSRLVLGEVLTTLEIEPTPQSHDDPCGTCTRCIEACPTDALTPFELDGRLCISALTIEQRSPIDPALEQGVGTWIFGCDACQDACPHNEDTHRTRQAPVHEAYVTEEGAWTEPVGPLIDILGWSAEDRHAACAGRALGRATLDMWRRNAAIAAGNVLQTSPDERLRRALHRVASDEDAPAMVRDAASRALG